jgi:hypothetical protein
VPPLADGLALLKKPIVGFSALYGFGAFYFAFVFLTVVATYVEPLAVHSVLHGLPYPEFPRLETTAVVNLVDQVGAFQLVDLRGLFVRDPKRPSMLGHSESSAREKAKLN